MADKPAQKPLSLREELGGSRRVKKGTYTEEERKQRSIKMASAQALALGVLKTRHEDEYRALYEQAKTEVGL